MSLLFHHWNGGMKEIVSFEGREMRRLPLRESKSKSMSTKMKACAFAMFATILFFTSCEKEKERVLIEETRRSTTKDYEAKLFATSDQRFRDAKPSPLQGNPPENWLVLPSTQMRILNYRFGDSGMGEVYVSISSGGVKDNADRWLKQFGKDVMSAEDFEAMEKVSVAGGEGVWVEAEGTFDAGAMGSGPKSGYGLAGVVVNVGGKILTVKMLGPKAEVDEEENKLRKYVGTLKINQS